MANGRLRQPRLHVACDVSEEPDALEGRSTVCSFSAGRATACAEHDWPGHVGTSQAAHGCSAFRSSGCRFGLSSLRLHV